MIEVDCNIGFTITITWTNEGKSALVKCTQRHMLFCLTLNQKMPGYFSEIAGILSIKIVFATKCLDAIFILNIPLEIFTQRSGKAIHRGIGIF